MKTGIIGFILTVTFLSSDAFASEACNSDQTASSTPLVTIPDLADTTARIQHRKTALDLLDRDELVEAYEHFRAEHRPSHLSVFESASSFFNIGLVWTKVAMDPETSVDKRQECADDAYKFFMAAGHLGLSYSFTHQAQTSLKDSIECKGKDSETSELAYKLAMKNFLKATECPSPCPIAIGSLARLGDQKMRARFNEMKETKYFEKYLSQMKDHLSPDTLAAAEIELNDLKTDLTKEED